MTNYAINLITPDWYVLQTKPRRELSVAGHLERLDEVTIFLPEILQLGTRGPAMAPLFPGYLFVRLDLQRSPAAVIHTPGVIGFVGYERQPTPVDNGVVNRLQEQVHQVNAAGGLPRHTWQPGDAVTFKSGPLQGLEAVFVGPLTPAQRVQVLLHFLGQQQQIDVDVRLLEARKASRRTRGQGRRIHP